MEDKELREKLLCILRNNIQNFEYYRNKCVNGLVYYNITPMIYLYYNSVYKHTEREREVTIKPKYFWQKEKTKVVKFTNSEFDYTTAYVDYGEFGIALTKEEYEEIMQIRQEKIKQKQLEELTKLCNNN